MGQDIEAVRRFAAGDVSEIQSEVSMPSAELWIQKQFQANYSQAKMFGIILAHHQPIDLLTGQYIDTGRALAWTNRKEYHHFFPEDHLKGRGYSKKQIYPLSNFIMLSSASNKRITNRAPSDYLRDVERAAGQNLDTWLASNLIPQEAYECAKNDDYDGFLRARSVFLSRLVEAKVQS